VGASCYWTEHCVLIILFFFLDEAVESDNLIGINTDPVTDFLPTANPRAPTLSVEDEKILQGLIQSELPIKAYFLYCIYENGMWGNDNIFANEWGFWSYHLLYPVTII